MNVIITVFAWLLLAVLSAMRFSMQPIFSASERARLVRSGNAAALHEQEQLERVPLLVSLQFVIRTLCISGFITYCVAVYGLFGGVLIGTLAVICLPLAFRAPFICTWADKLRDITLPWLEKAAISLRPLLVWIRERDVVVSDYSLHSQEELLGLIERSPGIMSSAEHQRLVASLAFDARTVGEIMTPRSVITGVDAHETLGPLVLDELYKTGYSRFPVYEKDIDHVVGMLYLHDLVDLKVGSKTAQAAMQSRVFYIHENRDLSHALHGFLKNRHHLFVVVNEYRETVGLLSLEDVLEALIGATIVDEFDAFDDLRAVAEHNPNHNNQPEGKKDI